MKYFEVYLVLNGKKNVQYLKALSKIEAVEAIQNSTGGTLLKIREVPVPVGIRLEDLKDKLLEKVGRKKVNIQEFAVFLRQLGVMTNAGISLRDALLEGISSTHDKQIKKIAVKAMEDIEAGLNLTDSLKHYEYEVGGITIAMIRMGEMTGSLAESFNKLATILESIKQNRDNIKKALRMPLISLAALIGAFIFLVLVVVPKFKGIFAKFGADLPLPTRLLLNIEQILSGYGVFILIFLAGAYLTHRRFYFQKESYRYKVDRFLLRIYPVGIIIRLSMLQRFVMVMAELLKAGIPLTESLQTAAETVENRFLKETLFGVNATIRRGSSLAEALDETELFERMVIQMVKSGEASGQIDVMLGRIAEYYKTRFQSLVDNIGAIIEPMLMIVVAGMVLLLALGIFLPMWDLAGAAQGR